MENHTSIKLFESKRIRTHWDENEEKWYFSVVDVVEALTDSLNARDYWFKMKTRVKSEDGIELSTICRQLKLRSSDGKKYATDVADMKGILRIIQSIPSPKAEPFKMWLAKVGKERIDEIVDPELTINRALQTYLQKGYSREWINQRLQAIQVRKELTDAWQDHGVKQGLEYAILTDEISKAWSGMTTRQYKDFKNLKNENLRDNMSTLELVLNMLAEATTTELTNVENPIGLEENRRTAKRGGTIAGNTRKEIEKETGKPVLSSQNALHFSGLIQDTTTTATPNLEDLQDKLE